MEKETCCVKTGAPYVLRECAQPVEYVKIGDPVYGGAAEAAYTGWYHTGQYPGHHAVPKGWTR